jgi:hypothetical protein
MSNLHKQIHFTLNVTAMRVRVCAMVVSLPLAESCRFKVTKIEVTTHRYRLR